MNQIIPRGNNKTIRNISHVYVLGGTHGNERTGLHTIQFVEENKNNFIKPSIPDISTCLANPKAVSKNIRYIDKDLNRSFQYDYGTESTVDFDKKKYEFNRAAEIRKSLNATRQPVSTLRVSFLRVFLTTVPPVCV